MKTVKIDIKSSAKSPRIELFVRIIWGIVSAIVLIIFGIIAGLCLIVHWFYILITGKRSKMLNDVVKKYLYYHTKVSAYLSMVTDERNPILPEE